MKRADDLFRIYRASGVSRDSDQDADLPGPLAQLLAEYASETAVLFFQLCARAIDYCPPVDMTFGDFLRAIITVSKDLDPADDRGVRDALMEAFRLRGIYSESASFFSEDALCWPPNHDLPPIDGLIFGSPNGLTKVEKDTNGDVLRSLGGQKPRRARSRPRSPHRRAVIPSRVSHEGQRPPAHGDGRRDHPIARKRSSIAAVPEAGSFPFRGGVTLIVEAPELKITSRQRNRSVAAQVYALPSAESMTGHDAKQREQKQRSFAIAQGLALGDTQDPTHFQANFGLLHEEY